MIELKEISYVRFGTPDLQMAENFATSCLGLEVGDRLVARLPRQLQRRAKLRKRQAVRNREQQPIALGLVVAFEDRRAVVDRVGDARRDGDEQAAPHP